MAGVEASHRGKVGSVPSAHCSPTVCHFTEHRDPSRGGLGAKVIVFVFLSLGLLIFSKIMVRTKKIDR